MNGQPPPSTGAPVLGGGWPHVSDVPLETWEKAVDESLTAKRYRAFQPHNMSKLGIYLRM